MFIEYIEGEESSFPMLWKFYGVGLILFGVICLLLHNQLEFFSQSALVSLWAGLGVIMISIVGIIIGAFLLFHRADYHTDEIVISNVKKVAIKYQDIRSLDHVIFQFGRSEISQLKLKKISGEIVSIYLPTAESGKYLDLIIAGSNRFKGLQSPAKCV